ncbi:MAG TPA: hypothetical protein VIP98_10010 [Microlunatus sp.]
MTENPQSEGHVSEAKVLIVVESEFGNTRQIAEAIAEPFGDRAEVIEVDSAPTTLPEGVELLIVGGPTHAFGLSSTSTRADAARQGGSVTGGIRDWLVILRPRAGCRFATFDTKHSSMKHVPGSAAKKAAKLLIHKGFEAADHPHDFFVGGTSGPLLDEEVDHARQWGEHLASLSMPSV